MPSRVSIGAVMFGTASAANSSWAILNSPTFESNTLAISLAFTADGTVGYAAAGSNSCPARVVKTTDSGVTWDQVWPHNCSLVDFNLLLSAAVKDEEHAVIGGAFYPLWTKTGTQFYPATNNFGSPPQDAGVIPGSNQFALVSGKESEEGGNSIDVSADGIKYTKLPIPDSVCNSSHFLARYGAFPSKNVWYITAGTFEGSRETNLRTRKISKYLSVNKDTASISFSSNDNDVSAPLDECNAAIVKTTDGGQSWELLYQKYNTGDNIYPNGIHCSSETHCVAVLEGASSRIIVTRDGGKTWNETMHDPDPHSSLFAVRMLSETEVWAAGGYPSLPGFEGRFWHSLDGGDTWTKEAFPGTYIINLNMPSSKHGYAIALTDSNPAGIKLFKYQPQ